VVVGSLGVLVALFGIVAVGFVSDGPLLGGSRELATTVRSAVDPSWRDARLAAAARDVRATYDLSPRVVSALRGRPVHADAWDIAAVWAYGLHWDPLPVLQTYSAYTPYLDGLDRDRLERATRPAVLRSEEPALDHRVAAWESPGAMVALTCGYEVVASAEHWQALIPTGNRCGSMRPLATVTGAEGRPLDTPRPRRSRDIVVATFDVPDLPLDRLAVFLLKPRVLPAVVADRTTARFVDGTASTAHLLRVPSTIDGAVPPNAGLDIRQVSFDGVGEPVTAHYFEIRTR
jgi:hypothetical protein